VSVEPMSLDQAADIFRLMVATRRHRVSISTSDIAAVYTSGEWRERYSSWADYLEKEHGVARPAQLPGPDARTVYFVQAIDGGPVKIGVTADVTSRLAGLQVGSPQELCILAVIPAVGRACEVELHDRFAESRLHGEWFRPTEDLMTLIADCARNNVP